jgi:hypothetical protein
MSSCTSQLFVSAASSCMCPAIAMRSVHELVKVVDSNRQDFYGFDAFSSDPQTNPNGQVRGPPQPTHQGLQRCRPFLSFRWAVSRLAWQRCANCQSYLQLATVRTARYSSFSSQRTHGPPKSSLRTQRMGCTMPITRRAFAVALPLDDRRQPMMFNPTEEPRV